MLNNQQVSFFQELKKEEDPTPDYNEYDEIDEESALEPTPPGSFNYYEWSN